VEIECGFAIVALEEMDQVLVLWVAGEAVVSRVGFFVGPGAPGCLGVDFLECVDVFGMCMDLWYGLAEVVDRNNESSR